MRISAQFIINMSSFVEEMKFESLKLFYGRINDVDLVSIIIQMFSKKLIKLNIENYSYFSGDTSSRSIQKLMKVNIFGRVSFSLF